MATLVPTNPLITIGQPLATADEKDLPSRTYRINWQTKRVEGWVDGKAAMEQAVHNTLLTGRFDHLIYTWNYGIEINDLLGESMDVVRAELPRLITEALKADARVLDVADIVITQSKKDSMAVTLTVQTIYGPVPYERTVQLYG